MIPILIAVAWLNLVTLIIAACRVAARADAGEMEIVGQRGWAVGGHSEASRGERLTYGVRVVGRGHQSTLGRIS